MTTIPADISPNAVTDDMTEAEVKLFNDALIAHDWVEAAKMVAIQAHSGQVDKQGQDYLFHPKRVSELAGEMMSDDHDPEHVISVALMHDVVEDSGITVEDLVHLFPADIVIDIEMLTRPRGMSYRDFIDRLAVDGSDIAITVKMADLEHNTDPTRGPIPPKLSKRYHLAKQTLMDEVARRVRRTFFDEWTVVPRDPSQQAQDEQFTLADAPEGAGS